MPTARRLGPGSVYVPDLAGFGLSGKPVAVLNVGEHADLVSALLDTLGTGPADAAAKACGGTRAPSTQQVAPDSSRAATRASSGNT